MAADCCEQMELRIFVLSRQHFFGTAAKQKLDSQCVSKFFLGRSFDPRRGHATNLRIEHSRAVGYSPAKFAQEAPAMFRTIPAPTVSRSLASLPGLQTTTALGTTARIAGNASSRRGKTVQTVPFRDKASQTNMVVP